jgi:hypothetical protein
MQRTGITKRNNILEQAILLMNGIHGWIIQAYFTTLVDGM